MLKNFLSYFKSENNFTQKWNIIQYEIENCRSSGDSRKLKELYIELQWLVTIREYDYKEMVIQIRKNEDFFKWVNKPFYQLEEGLDSNKVLKKVISKYTKEDLISPRTFNKQNIKHRIFAFDIFGDFEVVVRKTKFENLPMNHNELSFPKSFIYSSLTFLLEYCDNEEEYYVEKDYVLEMIELIEKFK